MKIRQNSFVLVALLAAGYYLVWGLQRVAVVGPGGSFDIYSHFYPNMVYVVRSVEGGGSGLLWNASQNCGQPFFGISSNGLLYPVYALLLLFEPDTALLGVLLANLTIAGGFTYLLCRELGLGKAASLSGALAFLLGNVMVDLTTWTPVLGGAYCWLPAAMLYSERILRTADLRDGIILGGILALSLLPGHPQVVMFAYQIIALRLLWELCTRRLARPVRTTTVLGCGLVLAPLLAAVQLLPGLEMAAESVRNTTLSMKELSPSGWFTWERFTAQLGNRAEINNPIVFMPFLLACVALLGPRTRRVAAFYAVAMAVFAALGFGPATPLFDWYLVLPLSRLFREPQRFFWLVGFCLAILTAFGVESIIRHNRDEPQWARFFPLAAVGLGLATLYKISPTGLRTGEWVTALIVVVACLVPTGTGLQRRTVGAVLMFALVLNLVSWHGFLPDGWGRDLLSARRTPFRRLLASGSEMFKHEAAFADLQARMTPQDRVYIVARHHDYALQHKSASLFGVPSLHDYEPQPEKRYSKYFVMLRSGRLMEKLADLHYSLGGYLAPSLQQPLLNLAAARYIIVDESLDRTQEALSPPPELVSTYPGVRIYENAAALPRARFVPRLEVVPNSDELLLRLAKRMQDPRSVALVETPPVSGFQGGPSSAIESEVTFLINEPESIMLQLFAPTRGFLVLSDVFFPGWEARVNGRLVPIERADFAFRAVEVPAGFVSVEFDFVPASVRIGAWISAATLVLVAFALFYRRLLPSPPP